MLQRIQHVIINKDSANNLTTLFNIGIVTVLLGTARIVRKILFCLYIYFQPQNGKILHISIVLTFNQEPQIGYMADIIPHLLRYNLR